jgi:tetratricopeptide (TPR) repeat protein
MRGIVPAIGVFCALAFAGARAQERPPVHAEEGSVAIGGNVSNSTIGVPYEKLEEAVRSRTKDLKDLSDAEKETNALLKEKLDLNQRQVKSALEILGEANVPPERLGAKLVEIAGKFKELKTAAAAQPGDDSKITALKAEVQKSIQDGELGKADEILAAIEKIQTEALDRLALNAAQTTAQRGDVALTRLRYLEAAQRFAEAAANVPQGHEDERWKYLNAEADALYRQGDEFGDNDAVRSAIERFRHLVELRPRKAHPSDWTATQVNLGIALWLLGAREESGTARLEEAVAAFREALQENTRAHAPLDWAKTQNDLGNVLTSLGERESGTARLEEAVAAFREALKENTREHAPLDWAGTQMNLGVALLRLDERESGTARLEEAVVAFREALQELTRARVPLQWAMAQNNLGNALERLGERESGTPRFEEAVTAFRASLKELTRERDPHQWAMAQNNLGTALKMLGEREIGKARLDEAITAYREVLKEYTRERVPLDWAQTQFNLASVYVDLCVKSCKPQHLSNALKAVDGALQEYRKASAPAVIEKVERVRAQILAVRAKL